MADPDRHPTSFVAHLHPPDDVAQLAAARAAKTLSRAIEEDRKRAEQRAQMIEEDRAKRAWIEAGNELRQPPEYRGYVWDIPTPQGVRPTAFPPYRDEAQGGLSDAFIAFQAYNQTRVATHPDYYCVDCRARYSAVTGGRCGPCISKEAPIEIRRGRRVSARDRTEYPD